MRSRGTLKRVEQQGRVNEEGKGDVVVSLRDVNEPVNMLTTTSEQFEGGSYMRPCIRPDRLLCRLHVPPPPSSPDLVLLYLAP